MTLKRIGRVGYDNDDDDGEGEERIQREAMRLKQQSQHSALVHINEHRIKSLEARKDRN